jgi:CRP-like cAMP-binding protein
MYEEELARVPLFQNLSWRERGWIADACRERTYLAGDDLMRRDSTLGASLFIILAGRVQIRRGNNDTAPPELVGVGAILGEQTLLSDGLSAATITAVEPTRALVLPIWDFRMTLRDFPDIAIHLLAILGEHLQMEESREPNTPSVGF